MQQRRGEIQVDSELGAGATFSVVLPPTAGAVAQSSRAPGLLASNPAGRSVLVVDDEPEVGATVRRMLGKEYAVTVGTGANSVPDLLEARPYDLILCDVMMPDMTCIELYRMLERQRPDLPTRSSS